MNPKRFKVSVYVPTKGWEVVNYFDDSFDAYILANNLQPLEVVVHDNLTGNNYWGGKACQVDESYTYVYTCTLNELRDLTEEGTIPNVEPAPQN